MKTLRLKVVEKDLASDPAIARAAEILRQGGLVAFPTETVYGLGGNALDRKSLAAIYAAKQRPNWDPILVHVSSVMMARDLVISWPEPAQKLSEKFWPGPLTLLLAKRETVPDECTAGSDKVGLRFPSHPVAQELIRQAHLPIAAPSANLFGSTSPTTADHVLNDLDGAIDAVLDAGPCSVGVESTVLDPCTHPPMIFRPGGVSREQLQAFLGDVRMAERTQHAEQSGLASPGLAKRHYAPTAVLRLAYGEEDYIDIADNTLERGLRLGLMAPTDWRLPSHITRNSVIYEWGPIADTELLAQRLYAGLHWLDEQKAQCILCPVPKSAGLGLAIHDRLIRAATASQ